MSPDAATVSPDDRDRVARRSRPCRPTIATVLAENRDRLA